MPTWCSIPHGWASAGGATTLAGMAGQGEEKGRVMAHGSAGASRNVSRSHAFALRILVHFVLVLTIAAAVGFALAGCSPSEEAGTEATEHVANFEQAEVVRVVDGDTLQVDLDGRRQRIRLIGINCPESVAADESRNVAEGVDASDYVKSVLHTGDVVWLQADVNDVDQYDRLLRYVWIELPADPFSADEVASKMLNAMLVHEGYAEARVYGEDDLYADELDRLEDEAVEGGRGVSYLWA